MVPDPSFPEVLPWLKTLPLAPEYRPTLAEFQDPIAYILRIEQEASCYGICKIVPPLPAAPKSTAIANLNLSFSARSPSGDPTFTTRQQQIGFCPRRLRPVQKSVWQSGNRYTLTQFEAKARIFERSHLRKSRKKKKSSVSLSSLEIESLFWKVATDKPSSVEYANDMPGSGFAKPWGEEDRVGASAENVGETAWNMRGVARAKGSLLRFMREEIPGVTSPMVYVAMMFSWFAWHVEDHDLHSLNYLHLGAGKTWYGVPRDAAQAFEEVVRVHGYGGEVNPLITFATLAEKTTLMSPEVLIGSGIPCCRLVQNAGEFVVTFPGSYHSGFSHGFNCGEASNIATPEWLKVAKEAAIRRASTNCPPMVSHYQLLYALALSQCLRSPSIMVSAPKSSRLRNKHRCIGETMIKEAFIQNMIWNNKLLNLLLDDGASCVILPQRTSDDLLRSSLHVKLQMKGKPRIALGLCHGEDKMDGDSVSDLSVDSKNTWARCLNSFGLAEENFDLLYQRLNHSMTKVNALNSSESQYFSSMVQNEAGQNKECQTVGALDQGLLSCVTCGILSYACMAIIQPSEAAAGYLISANSNSFANQTDGFEGNCDLKDKAIMKTVNSNVDINSGNKEKGHSSVQVPFGSNDLLFDAKAEKEESALALLVSAYGDLSDSEEDALCGTPLCPDPDELICSSPVRNLGQQSICSIDSENNHHNWLPSKEDEAFLNANYQTRTTGVFNSLSKLDHSNKAVAKSSHLIKFPQLHGSNSFEYACEEKMMQTPGIQHGTKEEAVTSQLVEGTKMAALPFSKCVGDIPSLRGWEDLDSSCESGPPTEKLNGMIEKMESKSSADCLLGSFYDSTIGGSIASTEYCYLDDSMYNSRLNLLQASDKNSSRMHVFCLEHAVEVVKRFRAFGGVNLLLLCHPEYPKIEFEAKLLAEELGFDYQWKDIHHRDASEQDREKIRIAIEDEAVVPGNGDWAVKLGINLYYSVNLSQSPLFRKQMPYNEVIYRSFSQKSAAENNISATGRRKKIILAGKWCGKVWMSNQVHPYLADQNLTDEDEKEVISEHDFYGTGSRQIVSKTLTNKKAAVRKKYDKKRRKLAARLTTKPPRSRLESDPRKKADRYEHEQNADDEPDIDRSGVDRDINNENIEIIPRSRASSNAAARSKSDKKRKVSAVRSSTMKPEFTKYNFRCASENSDFAEYADCDPNADRYESDTYTDGGEQAILSKMKSYTKKKISMPACARLEDSSDVESTGYYDDDDDQNRLERAESDIASELEDKPTLSGRKLTLNSSAARKNSSRKRKRSNLNCATKTEHSNPAKLLVKCSRSPSVHRPPLKGINGGSSNTLLRTCQLNSREDVTIATSEKRNNRRKAKKSLNTAPDKEEFACDIEGCSMSLRTKHDLSLHKRNICPEKGCGKKFFSHKYLLQHKKVHSDDRPLRCPWKGCKMTFKWAWARTEHIRVHTGERPYLCKEPGCDLTFRFVSDFSRHRRKTGH